MQGRQTLNPNDENTLRTFRSVAAEVRAAFKWIEEVSGELRVVDGYLESKDSIETYRVLCLPVRRVYLESDRVSFLRVSQILKATRRADVAERICGIEARYHRIRKDLASHTILNDQELNHGRVFDAWLDAVVFGGFAGKDRRYRTLLEQCGKAVEGVAVRITEGIGSRVLELDDVVADVLGEERG